MITTKLQCLSLWLSVWLITYLLTHLLTYLLTPWCRVLLEQLTGLQLAKKFPAFHGTRRFITALTSFRHLFLSWASPIKFTYPHPTSWKIICLDAYPLDCTISFVRLSIKNPVFNFIGCSTQSQLSICITKAFRYTIILCCS
jgi:hypothetical protein